MTPDREYTNMPSRTIDAQLMQLLAQAMQRHRQGDLPGAQALCRRAAALQPDNAEVRLCLGSILLLSGELPQAAESLQRAIELDPHNAAAYNNLGIALRGMGRLQDAIEAFRAALAIRPEHTGALRGLGGVLIETEAFAEAEGVLRTALELEAADAETWDKLAYSLSQLGRADEAIAAFRRSVELDGSSAGVFNRMGNTLLNAGNSPQALEAFQAALGIDPDFSAAHYNLGNTLLGMGRLHDARRSYLEALRIDPEYAEAHYNLGVVLQRLDRLTEAAACYRKAIACRAGYLQAHNSLGITLLASDRPTEAEAVFLRARDIDPGDTAAIAHLALLYEQTGRVDEAWTLAQHGLSLDRCEPVLNLTMAKCERRKGRQRQAIDRLQSILPGIETPSNAAAEINYELGFLHDLTGNTAQAFLCAERANRILARLWEPRRDESDAYLKAIDALAGLFTPESVRKWADRASAATEPDPVFLVGFPRSGTTLLDKIIDGHPRIGTMEEKDTMDAVIRVLATLHRGYPASVADLTAPQLQSARDAYFAHARRYVALRPGDLLIDKLPLNSSIAGLIWRVFPGARFLLALRHPCDVCLSCFRQNFHVNPAMAHFLTLEETVQTYVRVMTLWQRYTEILPLEWHTVRYEDLVDDLEGEARRILDFLGLEWNAGVLDYAETARARSRINTPSYTQVTRPIYRNARYRWERYREFFAPHLESLRPFIERFGYDPP